MTKYLWRVIGCSALISCSTWASSAHQHGVAVATLAIEQGRIEWQMEIPAEQLFGTEEPALTAAQQAQQQQQLDKLMPHSWLVWPAKAKCVLQQSEWQKESDADHANWQSHAIWQCQDAAAITQLSIELFQQTVGLEQLQVQFLTPTRQGAQTLTLDAHQIDLSE